MDKQEPIDIIEQVRHAILSEYARGFHEAALPTGNIHVVSSIMDVPIPEGLEAYTANTVVYVPGEVPSIYADYAFCLKDRVCTVLHDDLPCPGMTHEDSIKLFMDAIVEAGNTSKQSTLQTIDPHVLEEHMQRTAHMLRWYIEDSAIISLLRQNGFECIKDDPAEIAPHDQWYCTDCPIKRNGMYTLSDGTQVRSEGTSLFLCEQKAEK